MADSFEFALAGLDYVWVAVAAVAAFFLGFLWYGPLFGKMWGKEMGMNMDEKPNMSTMWKPMLLNFVGNLLWAYVLVFSIASWVPSLWAASLGTTATDDPMWMYALMASGFIWLGFFVPQQLNRVAWHERSWRVVTIDSACVLVQMLAMSFILAYLAL